MNKIAIRVSEQGGQFVAAGVLGGSVVVQVTGDSKREARSECRRALEEMGLITDGVRS